MPGMHILIMFRMIIGISEPGACKTPTLLLTEHQRDGFGKSLQPSLHLRPTQGGSTPPSLSQVLPALLSAEVPAAPTKVVSPVLLPFPG